MRHLDKLKNKEGLNLTAEQVQDKILFYIDDILYVSIDLDDRPPCFESIIDWIVNTYYDECYLSTHYIAPNFYYSDFIKGVLDYE